MCKYAMVRYKEHYACFNCRKGFKKPALRDLPQQPPKDQERIVLCPQCRQPMYDMGRDFKVPARNDRKQWEKVEKLLENGYRFGSCGCCGPGPRPARLQDVDAFLLEQENAARERERLHEITQRAALLAARRKKAMTVRFSKFIMKERLKWPEL